MKNVRKYRDIKRVTKEKNYLVSEPNYHGTKFCTEHLLATEMRKTQIIMNKGLYFGLSVLKLRKIKIRVLV